MSLTPKSPSTPDEIRHQLELLCERELDALDSIVEKHGPQSEYAKRATLQTDLAETARAAMAAFLAAKAARRAATA